jgi:hypothetical protein
VVQSIDAWEAERQKDQLDSRGGSWAGITPSVRLADQATISRRKKPMPGGDKSSYTGKQKRMAQHIAASYEDRGVSHRTAEERAWRTVNKETGGGQKSRGGR